MSQMATFPLNPWDEGHTEYITTLDLVFRLAKPYLGDG